MQIFTTDLGNGYSLRACDGEIGERLSTECRGAENAMIQIVPCPSQRTAFNIDCAYRSNLPRSRGIRVVTQVRRVSCAILDKGERPRGRRTGQVGVCDLGRFGN